jgi:hypothetical protein
MAMRSSNFKLHTSNFTLLLALLFAQIACGTANAALRGGCAKIDITPPLGILLIGSKGQPSDAIRDPLFAKAMVLTDGSETVALVSADLLYTPMEEITGPVRALVREKAGIPEKNIMVCATHTHSGPEVFTRSKVPDEGRMPAEQIDRAYLQVLVRKMADAVVMAHRNMQDVKIGAATGALPEVLFNRRFIMNDGKAQMAFTVPEAVAATRRVQRGDDGRTKAVFTLPPAQAPRQFGPIDPTVLALRMEDAEGRALGSMIGFGCHPVCIYPHLSTTISADYPAHATRVVEQIEGGTSLFLLGLAGNTVPLRRNAGPCEQMGKALGGEALKRLQTIAVTDDVTLQAATRELSLPLRPPAASDSPDAPAKPDRITTEIQVLRLGETYLVGLPGEILVEVGLSIRDRAGLDHLFVVTLANDAVGYVCHRQAYQQGGYEPVGGSDLAEGAGEILAEQALSLLAEMKPSTVAPGQ